MKTIKDAVIDLGGKWPNGALDYIYNYLSASCFSSAVNVHIIPEGKFVFSKEEFESEAKRLGYINGYRWGVEYPTNGKLPELADDLLVDRNYGYRFEHGQAEVSCVDWLGCKSFKITDQRYKPADTSYLNEQPKDHIVEANEMVDSSWHYRGELPPISTQCEWKGLNGGFWVQCEVIDKYQDKEMVVFNTGEYRNCRYEILKLDSVQFRPIRTEREKVIEAAEITLKNAGWTRMTDVSFKAIDALYDAGMLVLPQEGKENDA